MSLELHYQAWHQVCLNPSFHILWRGEREMSAVKAGSVQSSPFWWQESLGMAVLPSPHPWSKANWDTILPAICCLWHLLGWRMAMEMCLLSLLLCDSQCHWAPQRQVAVDLAHCSLAIFLPAGTLRVMERNAAVNLKDRVGWGFERVLIALKNLLVLLWLNGL